MFLEPVFKPRDPCAVPFIDDARRIVYLDIQSAEPGAFAVPGVIDLEIYEPGSIAELSWIFFKGDPQAGPQPGHPFEMPFDRYHTNFTVDLVTAADPHTTIRNIMLPTNSRPFWQGGAPFGKQGRYSMYIPFLDRSCRYYAVGEMIYRWKVPADLEADCDLRLKLTTDEPASTHLSGLLRVAKKDAARPSSLISTGWPPLVEEAASDYTLACAVVVGLAAILLAFWGIMRMWRSSRRVAL